MDVFDVIDQWFEPNTNRDSLRPNSPKMKIYRQADDRPAMLNDDLEKRRNKESIRLICWSAYHFHKKCCFFLASVSGITVFFLIYNFCFMFSYREFISILRKRERERKPVQSYEVQYDRQTHIKQLNCYNRQSNRKSTKKKSLIIQICTLCVYYQLFRVF